ncbi:MAG: TonB-dependent receptor [Alphaproteobacteria bacterium]
MSGLPNRSRSRPDIGIRTTTTTHSCDTVGADWAPTEDIRLRASYQRAVRTPNVLELFAPAGIGLFNASVDPCSADLAGASPVLISRCASTGAPLLAGGNSGLNSPAGQYNGLFSGNPNLVPEIGRTLTIGAVFTPTMLAGLTASIDWWDIRISKPVQAGIGGVNAFYGCYVFDSTQACNLIHRNPGNGRLWTAGTGQVDLTNTNISSSHPRRRC